LLKQPDNQEWASLTLDLTVNLGGEIFSDSSFELPQMVSAEFLAFGRGITRKLQGFGGNRNIFAARR
jgi:hypothetical protein